MLKTALHNLGCEVDAYETEATRQQLAERGYEVVSSDQETDVHITNICSVTDIVDRKSRQMLHRAEKPNPEAMMATADCYVQVVPDALKEDNSVDIITGNNNKARLTGILEEHMKGRQGNEEGYMLDITWAQKYEELYISHLGEHTRAFIKVQDDCNRSCSYCIVPYARGRVRSREPEDTVVEVEGLVTRGYREVVLTGIHLSSYETGHMEGSPVKGGDWDSGLLWDLIERIRRVEELKRIRLGSLESRIITRESVGKPTDLPGFCPHFHPSLQGGCDATLRRMSRHYTTGDYLRHRGILREAFDHPAITTDVIAGFPGETEEEFEIARRFLETVCFYEMRVFRYSKRQGTKVAVVKDQVSEQIKARRSDVLLELEGTMSHECRECFIGSRILILFEEETEIGGR